MKKRLLSFCSLCVMAALCVCLLPVTASAQGWEDVLPADNCEVSYPFALAVINFASLYTESMAQTAMDRAGFTVMKKAHFDKEFTDPGHTCAYIMGKTEVSFGGEQRTLILISVRGTYGWEWQSNFDFAPSHRDDTQFAENYAYAAMEAFLTLKGDIDREDRPLIIVCGHSRGAACADLLGALLDDAYGTDGIYVYTFATPGTVRGEMLNREYPNIFNFINPLDVVPRLPLVQWGYGRLGTDIILDADPAGAAALDLSMETLAGMAGSISEYYGLRHSFTGPGAGEPGMTGFELMSSLVTSLTGMGMDGVKMNMQGMELISAESDLYPVLMLLAGLNGEHGRQVLMQHMPDTYSALITRMMR